MADNFAFLFNCMPLSRTSDSMTVRGLMLWLLSGLLGFTCWISFARVFSFMCFGVLVFALAKYPDGLTNNAFGYKTSV